MERGTLFLYTQDTFRAVQGSIYFLIFTPSIIHYDSTPYFSRYYVALLLEAVVPV